MGKRILIVDDDPVIRALVSDIISSLGHSVEALASGADCISRLSHDVPDMLFLDLQMPDMTGFEVLKSIRDNADTAALPVVMLSANEDCASNAPEGPRPDEYLQKPFEMRELLSVLLRH